MTSPANAQMHIGFSSVVCGAIRGSGVATENIVMLEDQLAFGAVLPLEHQQFGELRRQYWAQYLGQELSDYVDIKQGYAEAVPKLQGATRVYVWAGASLNEHLSLSCVAALFSQYGISLEKLWLVSVEVDPITKNPLYSLASLSSGSFGEALKTARALSANESAELLKAWEVISSPRASVLSEYVDVVPQSMPAFVEKIKTLKWKYPYVVSGLNRTDFILLSLCKSHGPKAFDIFLAYQDRHGFDAECLDTIAVAKRLQSMANKALPEPLLLDDSEGKKIHVIEFQLTAAGEAVLAQTADNVQLNGVDYWVGGVHLESNGRVWRFDPVADRLIDMTP